MMAESNTEASRAVLQQIFTVLSDYASEKAGVADLRNASDEEVVAAVRKFLDGSDDIAGDVASRQAANEAINDIIDRIVDGFPDELPLLEGDGQQWRGLQQAITHSETSLVSAWTDSLDDD